MPCYDERSSPEYILRECEGRLNRATHAACYAIRLLNPAQFRMLPQDTQLWWRNHQEADRRREEAERRKLQQSKQREAALKKLTHSERKALGL